MTNYCSYKMCTGTGTLPAVLLHYIPPQLSTVRHNNFAVTCAHCAHPLKYYMK